MAPVQPKQSSKQSRMTGADRREQLLDVTLELVTERGFGGVSIEAVARGAGITRPIVYKHFGDLDGLLEELVEREMSQAAAQVSETQLAELTEGPAVDLMIESLTAYLHVVRTHPDTWRLVLMPPNGAPDLLRKRIEAGRAEVLGHLIAAVEPSLEGFAESPDAELTARMLSAISDEYARLMLSDPERFPPDRLLRHARWMLELGVSG